MANLSIAELQTILEFYQVDTIEELVAAQAEHVVRLQKTLTEHRNLFSPTFIASNPRIG